MLTAHINKFRTFLPEKDFISAGDFNSSGTNQNMRDMAQGAGFEQIDPNAISTFKEDNSGYSSAYDHIYISPTDTREFISGPCKVLDLTQLVYEDDSAENRNYFSNRVSNLELRFPRSHLRVTHGGLFLSHETSTILSKERLGLTSNFFSQ
jgi:hypothetical protein